LKKAQEQMNLFHSDKLQ